MTLRICMIMLAILLAPITIKAAVPTWQITPDESTITFTATQNNAPVSGSFKNFSGDIDFDPTQLAASHVRIVVSIDSATSDYKEVSDTLKTADWFDMKLFPQAIFTAHDFTKTGENTYEANGTLTMRDKTLPVVLTFVLEEYSKTKARVKGTTILRRTLFGIGQGEWKKTDEIKDDVQINFTLNAVSK